MCRFYIELCGETHWSCSFIAAYIGLILLFCIAPVGLALLPLATFIGGPLLSVFAEYEIAKYEKMIRNDCIICILYVIQVIVGLVVGMYVWGVLMILIVVVYALIWVIPVTNPFFSSWLILQLEIFSQDDHDDYEDR